MTKIADDENCPCGSGRLYRDCHIVLRKEIVSPSPHNKVICEVIPEPAPGSRSVFEKMSADKSTIFFVGDSPEAWFHCGKCDAPLATGMSRNNLSNLVLRCNACNSFNEVPSIGNTQATPMVQEDRPPRRNELCPCGSGKKYKHCHGRF